MKLTDAMLAAIANAEGSTGWELENAIFLAGYRMGAGRERERLIEAAEEWAAYVIEDNAPRTLEKHLRSLPLEENE